MGWTVKAELSEKDRMSSWHLEKSLCTWWAENIQVQRNPFLCDSLSLAGKWTGTMGHWIHTGVVGWWPPPWAVCVSSALCWKPLERGKTSLRACWFWLLGVSWHLTRYQESSQRFGQCCIFLLGTSASPHWIPGSFPLRSSTSCLSPHGNFGLLQIKC